MEHNNNNNNNNNIFSTERLLTSGKQFESSKSVSKSYLGPHKKFVHLCVLTESSAKIQEDTDNSATVHSGPTLLNIC